MTWPIYIFYGVCGILVGSIFAFLFIRMDEKWKTCVLTSVGLPSFLGILYAINDYMNIDNTKDVFYCSSVIYVLCLLMTACAVMLITGYLIKHQTGVTRIRFLDILLGYNKCFEQYYISRENEVKKDLNYDKLVSLKQEIEERSNINIEKEQILRAQLVDAIALKLPLDAQMPVSNQFLSRMPGYITKLNYFYNSIENTTRLFCENYKCEKEKINDLDFVLGYLSSICIDINTKLFNNSNNGIRSHFRFKYKDDYVKFIAFQGGNSFSNDLTKIPIDSGLIKHSFENKCSLLKSENRTLHHKSKNDGYWSNYLCFAVCDVCIENYPALSVGISVNDEGMYNEMLYFINFCKIERLISECISRFNSVCNIYEVVELYCSEMEKKENAKQI